jgi:hypothetical protein
MNCFDTVSPAFDVKSLQIQLQPPARRGEDDPVPFQEKHNP